MIQEALKSQHHDEYGFTLMELLISISVIIVILSLVTGAFRLGIKAVEKGEKDIDEQQRLLLAVNYIYSQLEGISLDERSLFQGTEDQMEFYSKIDNTFEEPVIQRIKYSLISDQDSGISEFHILIKKAFPITEEDETESESMLLGGITQVSFSYLRAANTASEWLNKWIDGPQFPAAVKIKFMYKDQPVEIFIRVLRQNKRLQYA